MYFEENYCFGGNDSQARQFRQNNSSQIYLHANAITVIITPRWDIPTRGNIQQYQFNNTFII